MSGNLFLGFYQISTLFLSEFACEELRPWLRNSIGSPLGNGSCCNVTERCDGGSSAEIINSFIGFHAENLSALRLSMQAH